MTFMGITCPTIAQTHQLNHDKYWYYRYRLENNFMKQGKEQGASLIANERGITNPNVGASNNVFLKFGDQTITLGLYIASLALEYNLLAQNNQSTEETIQDLYYAMWAFNRLDENEESLFRTNSDMVIPSPQQSDLNGFFGRDDVNEEFVQNNIMHFNNNKTPSQINSANMPTLMGSDWEIDESREENRLMTVGNSRVGGLTEMSQDQVFYMMLGCAMIHKFVPTSVSHNNEPFQDGEVSISQESENILHRMIRYMNGKHQNKGAYWPWALYNPITGNEVFREAESWLWSYGIANAACINDLAGGPGCGDFYNAYSIFPGGFLWNLQAFTGAPYQTSHDNAHMFGLLMAMNGANNFSPSHETGYLYRNLQHIPMIRQVLFGGGNPVSNGYYQSLLNDAPCEGPYFFNWAPGTPSHNAASFE